MWASSIKLFCSGVDSSLIRYEERACKHRKFLAACTDYENGRKLEDGEGKQRSKIGNHVNPLTHSAMDDSIGSS